MSEQFTRTAGRKTLERERHHKAPSARTQLSKYMSVALRLVTAKRPMMMRNKRTMRVTFGYHNVPWTLVRFIHS